MTAAFADEEADPAMLDAEEAAGSIAALEEELEPAPVLTTPELEAAEPEVPEFEVPLPDEPEDDPDEPEVVPDEPEDVPDELEAVPDEAVPDEPEDDPDELPDAEVAVEPTAAPAVEDATPRTVALPPFPPRLSEVDTIDGAEA